MIFESVVFILRRPVPQGDSPQYEVAAFHPISSIVLWYYGMLFMGKYIPNLTYYDALEIANLKN